MSRIVSYRDLIALGEHAELETQMLVAERRGYARAADIADFNTLSAQVGQLAHALLRSLEALE